MAQIESLPVSPYERHRYLLARTIQYGNRTYNFSMLKPCYRPLVSPETDVNAVQCTWKIKPVKKKITASMHAAVAVAGAASVNRNRLEAIIQSVTITLKE